MNEAAARVPLRSKLRELSSKRARISLREPHTLTSAEREQIAAHVLPSIPYPQDRFDQMIDGSDYLWLAYDDRGALVAVSAVRHIPARRDHRVVTLIYTAMVVIAPAYRRQGLVARFGMRSFLRERAANPFVPIYWLTLAASPAGFTQMTRNFVTSWPRPDEPTPSAARDLLRQAFVYLGIDRVEEVDGCFRLPDTFGVVDPSQAPREWDRSDPNVDFFLRVNPEYQRGSDLACLCPLDLLPLGLAVARQLRRVRGNQASDLAAALRLGLTG